MILLGGSNKDITNGIKIIIINIFLLLIFSFIYWLVALYDDNAFIGLQSNDNFINFIYFTITRIAGNVFHNMQPVSNLARGIASLQLIVSLYEIIAIFTKTELFSFKPFIKFFINIGLYNPKDINQINKYKNL